MEGGEGGSGSGVYWFLKLSQKKHFDQFTNKKTATAFNCWTFLHFWNISITVTTTKMLFSPPAPPSTQTTSNRWSAEPMARNTSTRRTWFLPGVIPPPPSSPGVWSARLHLMRLPNQSHRIDSGFNYSWRRERLRETTHHRFEERNETELILWVWTATTKKSLEDQNTIRQPWPGGTPRHSRQPTTFIRLDYGPGSKGRVETIRSWIYHFPKHHFLFLFHCCRWNRAWMGRVGTED